MTGTGESSVLYHISRAGTGSSVLYRMSGTGTGAIVHCVISVELVLGQ